MGPSLFDPLMHDHPDEQKSRPNCRKKQRASEKDKKRKLNLVFLMFLFLFSDRKRVISVEKYKFCLKCFRVQKIILKIKLLISTFELN